MTAPQQRKADLILNIRNVCAGMKSLLEILQAIDDDYAGQDYSSELNDAAFDPITFFFGENEGINKDNLLNFVSVTLPGIRTLCQNNKTTLASLSNNAKIYFE